VERAGATAFGGLANGLDQLLWMATREAEPALLASFECAPIICIFGTMFLF